MKIQYCSDLHLEFPVNKKYLKANPIESEGEILLLAGDVIPFAEMEKENDFFNFLSDSFEHTYWIPGNHEYYRSDISEITGEFHERIRGNVSLLNNTAIEHKGVRFFIYSIKNCDCDYMGVHLGKDFQMPNKQEHHLTAKLRHLKKKERC